MKKILLFAAAIAAVACAKEAPLSYNEFAAPIEEGLPEASVQFRSNVKATVGLKSQGGVDAWDATQNLHVYGFQRVAGGIDYTTATPFINNVIAVSPAAGAANNQLSVLNSDKKPFFYEGNNTYDFYGFYVDDLPVKPTATTTGIYVPVTITGGEDLMVAKADPSVDGTVLSDYRYAYSAYAARRGVQPTLTFKHQLVQFRFQITSGSSFETTGDAEKNLYVTNLTLNARNSADLYVAGAPMGLQNISEERTNLALRSLVDGELVNLVPYELPDKDAVIAEGANVLGESLMVIPNEDLTAPFKGELTVTQFGQTHPVPFTLKSEDLLETTMKQFAPGYSYVVTIKLQGLEAIVVSAELEPWKNGGKIDIDTDEKPEIF